MRAVLATALLLALSPGRLALAAGLAEGGVAARLDELEGLLQQEQIDEAMAGTEELYRAFPDVAPVQLLAGRLKFYQGDYQGAVGLLERSLAAYGAGSPRAPAMLSLARGALEVTGDYRAAESDHFIFRTPPGKDQLLAPYALEALEHAYDRIGAVFGYHPRRKVVVDVLSSAAALAKISPLTEEAIETSGTIALAKYGRLMITSPKALWRGYPWLDTLAHEYVHLLITERSRNRVPVWLQEGLAKYFESSWRDQAGQGLEPGGELLLAAAVQEGRLITFEAMHPSMALLPSREDTALAFAEVFTAVEFILKRHGDQSIASLLTRTRDGEGVEAALAAAVGTSYQRFVADWKRYLRERPYQVVPGAEPRRLVFKKKGQRDDLELGQLDAKLDKASRRWARLGDILRGAGRPVAAAVEYQRAVDRAGVRAPHLMNRLAATYVEAGDLERAQVTLRAALKPLPTDPQTHILLGRVALAQRRYDDARRAYLVANREHPFHPEIHASLLAVAQATGDQALAAREARALRLLSADASGEAAGQSALLRDGDPEAGFLTVESTPFARLLIDEDDLGLWTPLVELPLRPGKHTLRLRNAALGVDEEVVVEIVRGEHARIDRSF